MKAFTGLLAFILLGSVLGEDTSEEESQSGEDFSDNGCTNFAGELYNRMSQSLRERRDFAISPLGVSSVLGTLLFAVDETSATEITNFLYPKCEKSSEEALRLPIPKQQGAQLTQATLALVRRGQAVDKVFVDHATELGSYVFKTSFWDIGHELTEFVFNKTDDRSFFAFEGMLFEEPPITTNLLFYNRVRYRAQLGQKFSLVDDKLVARRTKALYADVDELKARVLGLSFLNTNAYLLILLPDEGASFESVENLLRTVDVRKLPKKLHPTTMDITLDTIVEYKYIYLRDALERAGIRTVFNKTTADLIAFNKEVSLDNVLVVTGIYLDEHGINTDTSDFHLQPVVEKLGSEESIEFKPKRPYIYAIVDSERVYIMGRISEHFSKD